MKLSVVRWAAAVLRSAHGRLHAGSAESLDVTTLEMCSVVQSSSLCEQSYMRFQVWAVRGVRNCACDSGSMKVAVARVASRVVVALTLAVWVRGVRREVVASKSVRAYVLAQLSWMS